MKRDKVPLQVINDIISKREIVALNSFTNGNQQRYFCLPRQIVMTLALEQGYSLATAAGYFGKDHATAIHARKTVYALYDTDKDFRKKFDNYRQKIKEGQSNGTGLKLTHCAIAMKRKTVYPILTNIL